MRGATERPEETADAVRISIHAPHAGRDDVACVNANSQTLFQSTRPMRGATGEKWVTPIEMFEFQSTRPMRGATRQVEPDDDTSSISIHAPHAGRDPWLMRDIQGMANFNPRAPCGARQQKYTKLLYTLLRQKAILRQFHAKHCLSKRFAACRSAKTSLFAVRTAAEISASFCFAL